jgi:hypothetical protein
MNTDHLRVLEILAWACKHEKIVSQFKFVIKTLGMLKFFLLISCLQDNHFKQLRKFSHNITILVHSLVLPINSIKSILFDYSENCKTCRKRIMDMKCEFHFYPQLLLRTFSFRLHLASSCDFCTRCTQKCILVMSLISFSFTWKWNMLSILLKLPRTKFHENQFSCSWFVTCRWTCQKANIGILEVFIANAAKRIKQLQCLHYFCKS